MVDASKTPIIGMAGRGMLNKCTSIQAAGIYGTNEKLTAVPMADQSKNGLNFPFLPFELSIIIDRIGERIIAMTEANIVSNQACRWTF